MIEVAGVRAIHCGDTIWHGRWYEIAARFAPFDPAFLPINGVMHQGLFNDPRRYSERDDAVARFAAAGKRRGMAALAPDHGAIVLGSPAVQAGHSSQR